MQENTYDTVVIGGGAAGLAGASKAAELGLNTIILENTDHLGGIPYQCTHPGFGNFYYQENLTGSEFSERLKTHAMNKEITSITNAHVSKIEVQSDYTKKITVITPEGINHIITKTILYTTGARERHVYETGIQGDRVSGIYTAGETQTLMDVYGVMPGKHVLIIGSGDIGLIMARRFALEGATVVGVIEMLPCPGGLSRNVVQCLHDFQIPLYLNRMVKEIRGTKRVEQVITVSVDDQFQPIANTEKIFECDTVALATGLIPYTKLLDDLGVTIDPATKGPMVNDHFETNIPGIFAAGNVLAINDYVDDAAVQGEQAAYGAHKYTQQSEGTHASLKRVEKKGNIRMVIPQYISGNHDVTLYLRVKKPQPNITIKIPEIDKEITKAGATPSQMITVSLSQQELSKMNNQLTIEVSK